MGMLHASKIPVVMEESDANGLPKRFNLSVYTASGELMECNDVCMLTYYHRKGVLNIKFPNEQVRKIRLALIVKFNNMEVFL